MTKDPLRFRRYATALFQLAGEAQDEKKRLFLLQTAARWHAKSESQAFFDVSDAPQGDANEATATPPDQPV